MNHGPPLKMAKVESEMEGQHPSAISVKACAYSATRASGLLWSSSGANTG
jgi:hypothetical protein